MISGPLHYYSKTMLDVKVLNVQQTKFVRGNIDLAAVSSFLFVPYPTEFLSCLCFKMLTERLWTLLFDNPENSV